MKDWGEHERRARRSSLEDIAIVLRRQQRFFPNKPPLANRDADHTVVTLKTMGLWQNILAEERQ